MTPRTLDIVGLGECMAEFAPTGASTWHSGFAGDVLNTLVYASRVGIRTGFISATGDDALSSAMRAAWAQEEIDAACAPVIDGAVTGLYLISTGPRGERAFTYYRKGSAASRTLSVLPARTIAAYASRSRIFYLSGITLAVMPDRARLLALLKRLHGRTAIAFDPNYRASLWSSPAAFRKAVRDVTPFLSFIFPSADDAAILYPALSPEEIVGRYARKGIVCVVKRGSKGALYMDGSVVCAQRTQRKVAVDTTGAGDAFNAGVLSAILAGRRLADAVALGNRFAGIVVGHRGAIVDRARFLRALRP